MMTRECEKALIVAAQSGDDKAYTTLWIYWRVMMMRIFSCLCGMTWDELESEAAEVFCTVVHSFDVSKVPSGKCSLGWILKRRAQSRVHSIIQKSKWAWQARQCEADDVVERSEYMNRQNTALVLLNADAIVDAIMVKRFVTTLTRAQHRVFAVLQSGLSCREMWAMTRLDRRTFYWHRCHIAQKLMSFMAENRIA